MVLKFLFVIWREKLKISYKKSDMIVAHFQDGSLWFALSLDENTRNIGELNGQLQFLLCENSQVPILRNYVWSLIK